MRLKERSVVLGLMSNRPETTTCVCLSVKLPPLTASSLTQQGSVYQKINAVEEIQQTNKDDFWSQAQVPLHVHPENI